MEYFWLTAEEQAVMAAAKASAPDFGWVGIFACGKAWKRAVEAMVGSKVSADNYLRTFNICRENSFFDFSAGQHFSFHAAVRLTGKQAMMMKLQHAGGGKGWVFADKTGESWANMQISAAARRGGFDYLWYWNTFMTDFMQGRPFGHTLSQVEPLEKLPSQMRGHFLVRGNGREYLNMDRTLNEVTRQRLLTHAPEKALYAAALADISCPWSAMPETSLGLAMLEYWIDHHAKPAEFFDQPRVPDWMKAKPVQSTLVDSTLFEGL